MFQIIEVYPGLQKPEDSIYIGRDAFKNYFVTVRYEYDGKKIERNCNEFDSKTDRFFDQIKELEKNKNFYFENLDSRLKRIKI